MHGGTGSAIMSDIGRMVRAALSQLQCHDYFLIGVGSIATTTGNHNSLPAAAAIATLCELDAQMEGGSFVPPLVAQPSARIAAVPSHSIGLP